MIRQTTALTLVLSVFCFTQSGWASIPYPDAHAAETAPVVISSMVGRPVVLSNGSRIGRVAAAWPEGPNTVLIQIRIDTEAGLERDALTVIVPGPLNPDQPIRLLLDHGALRKLVSAAAP